jgi:hypothetical protein
VGQCHSLCHRRRRPGHPGREGGSREGVKSGGGECRGAGTAREDIEGLVQKVALLEGELTEARRFGDVAEENFRSLSDAVADGA